MASRPAVETIAGRYRLDAHLGRGGMGTVWRAEDTLLRRPVAVKEVRLPRSLEVDEREAMRLRTLREARSAAALSHPRAVTVYDAIEHDDRIYIVMELVEAETLEELVRRNGPLSPPRAAAIGLDVLDVLEAAHRAGIVHRDVKPGNVMVDEGRGARLTDFGIAAVNDDVKITRSGLVLGSPKFMAPEQASGAPASAATDLWGLGATLYFAVEGAPPFDAEGVIATLGAIIEEEAPRPRRAGKLGPVLDALLQKDPAARPDPERLRAMLRDVREARPPAPRAPSTAPVSASPPGASPPARRTRRAGVLTAALLAVTGILAAGMWLERQPEEEGRDRRGGRGDGAPVASFPEGWTEFEVYETGAAIAYPQDWEVIEASCGDTCVDFRDSETGTYLRLDWQSPPGGDALEAWESQSSAFGGSHENYVEIAIEPVEFKGSDNAALWEYSYSEGGADLHAHNLGVAFDDYGFALNFQTRAENWDAHQDLWETFQKTFQPPPP